MPDINLHNVFIGKDEPAWSRLEEVRSTNYKLGRIKKNACTVAIFCFYVMSRNCIDILIDKKYDYLYKDGCDIHCETRLPSIMKDGGAIIVHDTTLGLMDDIHWLPEGDLEFDKNIPGFYHPVKNKVV